MKKFLYIELDVFHGEYENAVSALKVTKAKDLKKIGDKAAKDWYGLDYDKEMMAYSDGKVVVSCSKVKEIPQTDFEVLKKYLIVL